MPIFEYKCNDCGAVTEELVGVGSDRAQPQCSECGSTDLHKLISAAAVQVKGTRHASAIACGRGQTCCGRDVPCAQRPCEG